MSLSDRPRALTPSERKRKAPRRARRLAIEPLEDRAVPASSALFVKDINLGPLSSSASQPVNVNGTLFFAADDGVHGRELWKSDGTAAGTTLVKDIVPGTDGTYTTSLTAVGGTLFFTAFTPEAGSELWKSDGTEVGTTLVKDIFPGDNPSQISRLTAVGGTLFFTANDGVSDTELWKSDGTAEGTFLVKDIYPTPYPGYGSLPYQLTDFGGTLYFTANDGIHGRELWKSDGTEAGTVLVKDINPGTYYGYPAGSAPVHLTVAGETLFFTADDGEHGRELWKSDGTEGGTVLVKDIRPDGGYGYIHALTALGNELFFGALNLDTGIGLWKSNGTEEGTVLVKDINPTSDYSSFLYRPTAVGGLLFFTAEVPETGQELWVSDGTEVGTHVVRDIRPGDTGATVDYLTASGDALFFTADDGVTGPELWESDGTPEGTVLVKDVRPGPGGSYPFSLAAVGGALFFTANDGIHGSELWLVATQATVDVKPGTSPNLVNLNSNGFLPVAVLSTPDFNAANFDPADPARVRFGDATGTARVAPVRYALEDVDGDGDVDLLLFFSIQQLRNSWALTASTTSVELSGFLADNTPFVGTDSVQIVSGGGP